MSCPLAAIVARDRSSLEYASEQFEPSKDLKSSSLHWKKNVWDLGAGFSIGGVRKMEGLATFWFFYYDIISRTKGQNFGSLFGCILGWNMKL